MRWMSIEAEVLSLNRHIFESIDVFAELFRIKCLRTAKIIAIFSDFCYFKIKPEMRDVLAKMQECGK